MNVLLWLGLRGQPYSIFIADQRLWIPDKELYPYPDRMVMANPVELQLGRTDTVMNPAVLGFVPQPQPTSSDV